MHISVWKDYVGFHLKTQKRTTEYTKRKEKEIVTRSETNYNQKLTKEQWFIKCGSQDS